MIDVTGNILVIDDEKVISKVLEVILEEDYTITKTTSAVDGLALARAELPDLILLDIHMPEIDGYELCRLLKTDTQTKNIPIIFVTALSTQEDETKGLEAGAADYIVKPINPSIVQARVKNQMEVKKQRDYLEKLSTIDSMTGVYNRRYLDECLSREWRRCQRAKTDLSIVLIDIDTFKAYNDKYGHVAGDDCLRLVAEKLKEVPQRGGDILARYGGEEFMAILPETPYEFLSFMAEKFRSAIEEAAIHHFDSEVSDILTVSVGAATVKPDKHIDMMYLVKMADKMLYKAKGDGRNRACIMDLGDVYEDSIAETAEADERA